MRPGPHDTGHSYVEFSAVGITLTHNYLLRAYSVVIQPSPEHRSTAYRRLKDSSHWVGDTS